MASVTGLSKIGLPHLSENMDAEDARAIRNYLYQMQEQLLIPDAGAITICALQSGRGKYVGAAARPAEQHPVRKENL